MNVTTACPGTFPAWSFATTTLFPPSAISTVPFRTAFSTHPVAEMSHRTLPAAPLRFASGNDTSNVSPGATKRGASGWITSFGATFRRTDAAPVALSDHATAVTRTSPTNSGSLNSTRAHPPVRRISSCHSASGLNRRVGTGLTRPSMSASPPPPVFTPLARSPSPPMTGSILP